uniref:18 kDa Sin3-associated polypeptide n=1 Tax=Panagrellus redivivus TaxID=6233 RepID=A0A7E4VUT5_PANRE
MVSHAISEVATKKDKSLDREKVCPFLLRIFCTNMRHNSVHDYSKGSTPTNNELQVYTWFDCSLKELKDLVLNVDQRASKEGTIFDFSIVSPDRFTSRMNMRNIGVVVHKQEGLDDKKTLQSTKFEIGDYIDVAITYARQNDFGGRGDFRRSDNGPRRQFGGPRRYRN